MTLLEYASSFTLTSRLQHFFQRFAYRPYLNDVHLAREVFAYVLHRHYAGVEPQTVRLPDAL